MMDGFFKEFHIGTYCLSHNARDEEHVRELAECGIDLIFYVNNDRALLDLLQKYGVRAVVNGVLPGWFGADGKNAGTMQGVNTEDKYIRGAEAFTDHPAIVGIDIGDEPSSLDFPYYGKVAELLFGLFPGKLLYLNIYPSYGMLADAGCEQARAELGTDTYAEYLEKYCECVKLPYLSIDHYLYSSDMDRFLSDLSDASDASRRHSRHLMVVLQVNSKDQNIFLSADQLRIEAWCALAYGARSISWACYQGGWWHNNVLDKDGCKTEQYEKLKTVNRELRTLTEDYCDYSVTRTTLLKSGDTLCTESFGKIITDGDVLIGEFKGNGDKYALFCVPLNFENSITMTFESADTASLSYRAVAKDLYTIVGNDKISFRDSPIFIYSK